jgi:hypothetical protein
MAISMTMSAKVLVLAYDVFDALYDFEGAKSTTDNGPHG